MTINVLLADDSSLARQLLTDMLHQSPDVRVIACDGRDAVNLTLSLKPNLVIINLLMEGMDSLQATEDIMASAPTPVLVLSAAVEATALDRALHAIRRGALEVMEKPALEHQGVRDDFACRLLEKVRLLSGIRVIRHPRRRSRPLADETYACTNGPVPNLLAIGASTGGPKAVMSVLKSLPADFQAAVFVVQHIAYGFTEGFATWLGRECAIPVKLALDGARCHPGEAIIAPDGSHLTVAEGKIKLIQLPAVNCCRPSIDVFFDSLAQAPCEQVVGLLLSGMGKDGAQGLLRIKQRGGTTIVQDELSCSVYGMPRAAISLDAANQVLALDDMPAAISKLFAVR